MTRFDLRRRGDTLGSPVVNRLRGCGVIAALVIGASVFADSRNGDPDKAAVAKSSKKDSPKVHVSVFNRDGELVGPVESAKLHLTDKEWKARLTPEQYKIARAKGTEPAFCGTLLDNKQKGVYTCVCCGLPLFSSVAKFNSGTGWPSFFQPIAAKNVVEHPDYSDVDPADGNSLRSLRLPPRARFRRRASSDAAEVLLKFGISEIHHERQAGFTCGSRYR